MEVVCATLSKFEMLVLGKDNVLYSWIWKEETKLKKYRKLDIIGVSMVSLRGSEAFLIKRIAIPQLTQIIQYPKQAYSNVAFSMTLALHDQFAPSFIPDAGISIGFTGQRNGTVNEIEYELRYTDDDDNNTIVIVTPYGFGELWMHIYVEKQEINSSPLLINIAPSPTEEVLLLKINELRALDEMISNKKVERARKRGEEKEKAVEDRDQKMERTRKRAQEALKNYLEKKEAEIISKERDHQRKIKSKTGGGYIIPY